MQIAKNGLGTTRPNPSVGAVIVHNNKIIAEGFTSNYGSNHAEVNAITAVLDKSLLKEATIYVTLEPCSHFGKTPPCADLIVKHNFKKVVIGTLDTNSMVAGKGVERLKNAGIEVIVGVLEEECKKHHKRFFTNQNKKRPYTILKWAESQDGFIAPNYKEKQQPVWISNQYSQQIVHKLRSKEHAILVGTNTVIADNPKLNVRSWTGNNPTRVVLDNHLRLPKSLHVFDNSVKTIFITDKNTDANSKQENMVFEKIDFQNNVAKQIISILQKHKIQSLIVEGGAKTLQTFIDENLWDEAMVFVGDVELKEGVKGPEFDVQLAHQQKIKNDTLKVYIND
ncbi:Riboflavin biosynthesis protein RibD [Polaribacter dokdonensis DSW-5]|uniref:Riboflavin biosynthesis protein RibD n=1 Tax=Polaribacter dokdonensis DSW-5 TaxID=1300348 RepID=A0A0M9CDY3_9FLAO|nr:Riboflavin biosynthesis protein RibD [Polaribacter dokdonensis DSW-5]SEE27901.1 diaminohydroxyphosphoribosylaminopyrimidine deaminase [Polaribacter dokdonensis DSW-5]